MLYSLLRQNVPQIRSKILTITMPHIPQFHTLTKIQNTFCSINRAQLNLPLNRNYFWIFRKRTKKEIILADNPPAQYELIYRSGTDNYFSAYQHLSFYGIVIISGLLIWNSFDIDEGKHKKPLSIYEKNATDDEEEDDDGEGGLENVLMNAGKYDNTLYIMTAFAFMYSMLHFVISRAPARIYFHPHKQKYLVYYYGMLPKQIKTLELKPGDLLPPTEEQMQNWVPFVDILYKDKESGRHFLLIDEYFRRPADLHIMLGIQKDVGSKMKCMDEEGP